VCNENILHFIISRYTSFIPFYLLFYVLTFIRLRFSAVLRVDIHSSFFIPCIIMDLTYVEDYQEDEESDAELSEDEPRPKRRRKMKRTWIVKETFDSPAAAEKAVEEMKVWKKCSTKRTTQGETVYYRCAAGRYRKSECPAGIYLLYHSNSDDVSLYEADEEHQNHTTEPSRGLSMELKSFISKKYSEGITIPEKILSVIRSAGMPEPSKQQLNSFLTAIRSKKYGPPCMSAVEIRRWCEKHKNVPAELDEPFVLACHIHAESFVVEEQDLKIVISTRRLLSLARKSRMMQTDGSYKLVWQGYPIILVGTSDVNNTFHPFVLAILKGETEDDYAFAFEAIRQWDANWKPDMLLADGSDAITAAYMKVFGVPVVRIMCYFHVRHNCEKYLKTLGKKRDDLLADIEALQHCESTLTFEKASLLFCKKWKRHPDQRVKDFIHYFHEQWLIKYPCWYEGAARGLPSTNNGVEATNSWMKRSHTLRERLPVNQFLVKVFELVHSWSERRDPGCRNYVEFAETPSVPLRVWTQAYHWALANKRVVEMNDGAGGTAYFIGSSRLTKPLTLTLAKQYMKTEGKWTSFDTFKKEHYSIWRTTVTACLEDCECSCPFFLKQAMCKHVIGMQIRLKLCDAPQEAKNIPMGQKRKRGRPSKSKKALMLQ
jgi:hypothetical protein